MTRKDIELIAEVFRKVKPEKNDDRDYHHQWSIDCVAFMERFIKTDAAKRKFEKKAGLT